jgi:TonB-linked SusC/RagA family outer membrane protein
MQLKSKCCCTSIMVLFILFHFHSSFCQQNEKLLMGKHVTFSGEAQPISKIEEQIRKQTGFFLYYSNQSLDPGEMVSLKATNEPLPLFLTNFLAGRNLQWYPDGKFIVIKKIEGAKTDSLKTADNLSNPAKRLPERRMLLGTVKDKDGTLLIGASVRVDKTNDKCIVDQSGKFVITTIHPKPVLIVSYTGYETGKYIVSAAKKYTIILNKSNLNIDETIVIAYGTSSKRLSTGSVNVVKSDRIEENLNSNPFLSLQGNVPGLVLTPSSGVPGASVGIQIHGQNSFQSGLIPLIIIDEVPLAANNEIINTLTSIASQNTNAGLTPLTSINGAEIESFSILKGADATAIYGSRGANGVILITTKRATPGVRKVTFEYTSGSSSVGYSPEELSTRQYLSMRREAFKNDGIVPDTIPGSIGFAPDLLLWDTTRNTNLPRELIGGHARISDTYVSYSDGTARNTILVGCGMYRESTVLPADFNFWRGTFNSSIGHLSEDGKFTISLSANYSQDRNDLFDATLKSLYLPPNIPNLLKDNKEPDWVKSSTSYDNPFADFLKKYRMSKENQLMNLKMAYKIIPGLSFRSGFGYNKMSVDEHSIIPISSLNPALVANRTGTASFASGDFKSFIIEPTAEYKTGWVDHYLTFLLGGSWQYTDIYKSNVKGVGYTNDAQLEEITAANSFSIHTGERNEYKYGALFGRVTYNYNNKFIVNLSARRDGSSRFSRENRFHTLGAIGVAYIFTADSLIKAKLPFLSFGKLRASYGITGNDQIGDYKYLDTRSPGEGLPYGGIIATLPDGPYNKNFYWEKCSKMEISSDLYFFEDRLMTTFSFFRNISSHLLLNQNLPTQTGFSSILQNNDTRILNRTWEFSLFAVVIKNNNFSMTVGGNLTVPVNKLLAFDDRKNSGYEGMYVKGESMKVLNRVQVNGVDPVTGKYALIKRDGQPGFSFADCAVIGKLDPTVYGGVTFALKYRNFELKWQGEFRKQMSPAYLHSIYGIGFVPGTMNNQDPMVLDHWKEKGDRPQFAKYTTSLSGEVYRQINDVLFSEKAYSDVTFFKLGNCSISYDIPMSLLSRIHFTNAKVICKGQNIFTITNYKGGDPVTANSFALPSQRVFSVGLQFQL